MQVRHHIGEELMTVMLVDRGEFVVDFLFDVVRRDYDNEVLLRAITLPLDFL